MTQPSPVWFPEENFIKTTNIAQLMRKLSINEYNAFHQWSVKHYPLFWERMINILNIQFDKPYQHIVDATQNIENIKWLPGASFNIAASCFTAPAESIAIISECSGFIREMTYGALDKLSNQIANSLSQRFKKGERIAIIMPMHEEAVALYLGVIKAGCVVVSIADSFSAEEIALRLQIAKSSVVFTQDHVLWHGKILPLYQKIVAANPFLIIVLTSEKNLNLTLRQQDINWHDFLSSNTVFEPVMSHADHYINILFSSGTTGEPKAIPWTQTTPIKCGSDAYLHHNMKPKDIFCWPSSLGWMMGPWLIFAALMNKGTLALYEEAPIDREFGQFIASAKVTHLGVVPTLVRTWKQSACMEGLNWNAIKLFSSTGECSNTLDMLYLMSLANNKPVIEYCGGTEIGGAYITGTVIQPCAPGFCTTPALGLDFVILDEEGAPTNKGEVAVISPSIGLSAELLNNDHHIVYYSGMPILENERPLRRHGDQIEKFPNGYYRVLGRMDDTLNLSGVKVSCIEIETLLNKLPSVYETAAVAVESASGGPSQLHIYTVLKSKDVKIELLKIEMQKEIKEHLNPLFKIDEVIIVDSLPRTASNKIMRRILRKY